MGGTERPSRPRSAGPAPPDGAPVSVRWMSNRYRPPELLASQHGVSRFECGSREQARCLRRFARRAAASGTTPVFVVTAESAGVVVAYYAWCRAQVAVAGAPERLRKGAGRSPQPVALLARLGVDIRQ